MSISNSQKCNPILYYHEGLPIRRYNTIKMRVDEITYREIIDAQKKTGMSIRKIIGYSGSPCERCESKPVKIATDEGVIDIKRGILSKRIPASFGNTVRNHEPGRKVINTKTEEIFNTVKEVSDKFGIPYTTLLKKLNKELHNNTDFLFYEQTTELRQNNQQKTG